MYKLFHFMIIFCGINYIGYSQHQSIVKKLAEDADLILTGKVKAKKSLWNENKTRIVTQVIIEAEEYIKAGGNQKEIVVTHFGGEIGEIGEFYSHMPNFKSNEEVLLFLKENMKDKNYKVLYGEEGKLTLYKDMQSGEKVTSFNENVSALKKEIKRYIEKR